VEAIGDEASAAEKRLVSVHCFLFFLRRIAARGCAPLGGNSRAYEEGSSWHLSVVLADDIWRSTTSRGWHCQALQSGEGKKRTGSLPQHEEDKEAHGLVGARRRHHAVGGKNQG
jgi:hypothetical protein